MFVFLFWGYDSEKKDLVINGAVVVKSVKADPEEAEVLEIVPESFEKYLEDNIYGQDGLYIELIDDETDKFDPYKLSHWKQLPIARRFNGMNGISMMTLEEFDKWCTKRGIDLELDKETLKTTKEVAGEAD